MAWSVSWSCVHSTSIRGREACWSLLSWSTQVQSSACDSTPLRASDTFSTTKHVSLCNIVSLLNVRNIGFCRICVVCFPIDADPRVGKPTVIFMFLGWRGWISVYLFCWTFGAIFIQRLFKYPGTLTTRSLYCSAGCVFKKFGNWSHIRSYYHVVFKI